MLLPFQISCTLSVILPLGTRYHLAPPPFPEFISSHLNAPRSFPLTWLPLSSALPPCPAALSFCLSAAARAEPALTAHLQPLPHLVFSRTLWGRALAALPPQGDAVHGAVLSLLAPVLQRRLDVEAGSEQCPPPLPWPVSLGLFPEQSTETLAGIPGGSLCATDTLLLGLEWMGYHLGTFHSPMSQRIFLSLPPEIVSDPGPHPTNQPRRGVRKCESPSGNSRAHPFGRKR